LAKTEFLYVFAHGAGAGMNHPFMQRAAQALEGRGIATHRFEFPYMQAKKSRPDPPAIADHLVPAGRQQFRGRHAIPRQIVVHVFGGRVARLAGVDDQHRSAARVGVLWFPLHAPGKPGTEPCRHLSSLTYQCYFCRTCDEFAQLDLLQQVVRDLDDRATLHLIEDGDHSFKVPKRSGKTEADVMNELADTIHGWMTRTHA
jgi:predicted alpha/beta-hydrolase family hydrolase